MKPDKRQSAIKTFFGCLMLTLLLLAGLCGHSWAQDEYIDIRLGLENPPPGNLYLFNPATPDTDPINAVVTIENVSDPLRELLASKGYADNLHLSLTFFDSDGAKIIAQSPPETYGKNLPTFPDFLQRINVPGEPVELVPRNIDPDDPNSPPYSYSTNPFNLRLYYSFPKAGRYTGTAFVGVGIYETSSRIEDTDYAASQLKIFGQDLISNEVVITLIDDADGDGACVPEQHPVLCPNQPLEDCEDRPAGADGILGTADDGANIGPGRVEIAENGLDDDCNPATLDVAVVDLATIKIKAAKYILSWGSWPRKEPLELPVRVFDISEGSCARGLGSIWQNYGTIWSTCQPQPYGVGQTDDAGKLELKAEPGHYIVIGQYQPDTGADDIYIARLVLNLEAGETVRRHLFVIESARGRIFPCRYFHRTGSELFIVEPEYVEWDGQEETYPFVFESEGDWDVTTSVDPPEGFEVDENKIKVDVNSTVKAVEFTITDEGTKWHVPTEITYDIKNKKSKKKEKIKSKVYQKLTPGKAKKLGLDIYGNKIKKDKKKKK